MPHAITGSNAVMETGEAVMGEFVAMIPIIPKWEW